ncbi:MAG: TIM44-like domain-containing protein [Clostridia bacterium]|nr:TIM44-like domain-containing protein [Clostridia bacterium]
MRTIITILIIIIILVVSKIIDFINKRNIKSKIEFNEFDDLGQIKENQRKEEKELEYEAKVLNKVYMDTYEKSMQKSYEERRKSFTGFDKDDERMDRYIAYKEASEAREKARQDLENFKVLDAVEVKKENVKEGVTISALKENGYNFDFELFKDWCKEIFLSIKSDKKDQMNVTKNFISDELYGRLQKQKKDFERDGLEFVTEDLIIEECSLYEYSKSMTEEEIKVLIEAEMKEYILQRSTNEVVKGSNKKSYNKKIIMTFTKNSNSKNASKDSEFSEWKLTKVETL